MLMMLEYLNAIGYKAISILVCKNEKKKKTHITQRSAYAKCLIFFSQPCTKICHEVTSMPLPLLITLTFSCISW